MPQRTFHEPYHVGRFERRVGPLKESVNGGIKVVRKQSKRRDFGRRAVMRPHELNSRPFIPPGQFLDMKSAPRRTDVSPLLLVSKMRSAFRNAYWTSHARRQ